MTVIKSFSNFSLRVDTVKDIKILVATHKPYDFPEDTSIYMPVQVGCDEVEDRFGYTCDNTGDNISYKHRYYSDLSSLYWGWKNLDCEYIGTCHYRRYFVSKKAKKTANPMFKYILSREELETLLDKCPVIIAKPRKYYIETIRSHYNHSHNPKDFDTAREVIAELAPDYLENFDRVSNRTWAHIFNTFIMRKDIADAFCEWMYPILFELEKRVDFTGYSVYEARVCGYISEFLLDTWLEKNNVEYQTLKLAMLEKPNWLKKGFAFLKKKFIKSERPF